MRHIRAIGFDLFNTLIFSEGGGLDEAVRRLVSSLESNGFSLDHDTFKQAYHKAAIHFIEQTRKDWRETHNRYWISAALKTLGYEVPPEDPGIARAVESYFSAFLDYCHLIPGTIEMLSTVRGDYRLGLLSNFTDAPAALRLIDHLGISHFFDVVLISGELGYRKPHPLVFRRLIEELRVEKDRLIFIGDDLESDIRGAQEAGLIPVWMTYVHHKNIPFASGEPEEQFKGLAESVSKISTWPDLISLLDNHRASAETSIP